MTVSVIITCYNYCHFLSDAIESVLAQSFDPKEIEIIVVNDGSTDDTIKIAAKYPVKLVDQPNLGLPSARNNGIKTSRGKYILPLDADDKIAPQYMESTVAVLEAFAGVGVVHTHRYNLGLVESVKYAQIFDLEKLRKRCQLNYCSLFRRMVWNQVGGYNPNMIYGCEDWDFWLSIAQTGWQFKLIDQVLFYYRKHGPSLVDVAINNYDSVIKQIYQNHPDLYLNKIPIEHANGISYFLT